MDDIQSLKDEIDKRVHFINTYVALGESHMVDFFVQNHWNTLVHPDAQSQLLQFDEDDLYSVKNIMQMGMFRDTSQQGPDTHTIQNLKEYFSRAKSCAIDNSTFCMDTNSVERKLKELAVDCESRNGDVSVVNQLVSANEYMCNKKSHEVEEMSHLVQKTCQKLGIKDVLDMGSGKGYLGTHLSLKYDLNVVGVDCSEANSVNASSRAGKFLKYWNAHLKNKSDKQFETRDMKYQPVTALVHADSDINFLFVNDNEENSNSILHKQLMLTGLHICGDLSSTALRMFVSKKQIKAACLLGCCYHHLTSKSTGKEYGFPMSKYLQKMDFSLGRNSKMLGLKALDRMQDADIAATEKKSTRSLFYRAVLSVILEREFQFGSGLKDLRVGKVYSKSKNFIDYVRRSLSKLSYPDETSKILSDDAITSYMNEMENYRKTLLAFNALREAFSPAVEAIILLDKLLYLREHEIPHSYLVKLFDPVKSPRCYALVSIKSKD
uniref:LOW QUALITY PROTEIN: methyltransferase-like protein 25 n=1 Tax=Styela clava TaxID=7725 RepID=UPI0019393C91|nr:LOW QUALITY PROTEIN: methyltransferase-like protein 25 [Styela clava]